MWRDGDKVTFRTKVKERDKVVLSAAAVELYRRSRRRSAKAKPAAAGAGASARGADHRRHLRRHREVPREEPRPRREGRAPVFQFNLAPDSVWTLDLKATR